MTRFILLGAACLGWLFSPCSGNAAGISDPFPGVASSYLVKIDGKPVWGHQPHRKLPPASLTKMMTSLITLEKCRLDETVRVSPAAARETGHRLGLRRGEKLRASDLLAAALLYSANDACRALADHVGGKKGFVALMNARAKNLGMRETHFTNPSGHHHAQLYSTAHDLSLLAEKALAKPSFAHLVKQPSVTIQTAAGRQFRLESTNALIGRYAGAIGVKTGYTPEAGKCLVALAERDGRRVLLVLLNAPNRWWDAEMIFNRAFASAEANDRS